MRMIWSEKLFQSQLNDVMNTIERRCHDLVTYLLSASGGCTSGYSGFSSTTVSISLNKTKLLDDECKFVIKFFSFQRFYAGAAIAWGVYRSDWSVHYKNVSKDYCCSDMTGTRCAADDLSLNSKCYRKFHNSSSLSWFIASNDCLSRGGSLAVFTDIGRPSDNSHLVAWLNASGTDKTYWIGLVRSWWKTTDKGLLLFLVEYKNYLHLS